MACVVAGVVHAARDRLVVAVEEAEVGADCDLGWAGAETARVEAVHILLLLPKELSETQQMEVLAEIRNCPVSQFFSNPPQVELEVAATEPGLSLAFDALASARA